MNYQKQKKLHYYKSNVHIHVAIQKMLQTHDASDIPSLLRSYSQLQLMDIKGYIRSKGPIGKKNQMIRNMTYKLIGMKRKYQPIINGNKDGPFSIINNIGWAYDVPIYNDEYYDCAQFANNNKFDFDNFGLLCLRFAVRSDLKITRDLRQITNSSGSGQRTRRTREFIKWGEGETGFYNSVPDAKYRELFGECFIWGNDQKHLILNIDLRSYCSQQKLRVRGNEPFITFERGYYIRKDMINRLMLLMKLAVKHITIGAVKQPVWKAPWYKDVACIIDDVNGVIKPRKCSITDLTNSEDVNGVIKPTKCSIKKEYMSEDEYDSQ